MRRHVILTLVFLLLAASGAQAQAQQGLEGKIAYINSEMILQNAPGAQEARQQVNQALQGYQSQVQEMAQELEQMIQQYEQQELTLSAEAKEERQQEIRTRQQEYQQRVQQLDQEASQRQQELIQPVMDRINRVIESIREEGDYALIFDVSAGAIISADPDLDITDAVIRRLQAGDTGTGDTGGAGSGGSGR